MPEMEPITREETYYARTAGDNITVPEPVTHKEHFLYALATGETGNMPEPVTREEHFIGAAAENVSRSSVTVEPLSVTENGTYTAPSGKAYSPVTVNVDEVEPEILTGTIASPFSIEVAEEIHAGCFLGMATKTATIYVPFFGGGYVPCAIFGQGTKDGAGGIRALICGMGAFMGNISYGLITLSYVLDSDAAPYKTLEAPMLTVRKALSISAGDTPAIQDMSVMLPETATTYTVISTSQGGIYPID